MVLLDHEGRKVGFPAVVAIAMVASSAQGLVWASQPRVFVVPPLLRVAVAVVRAGGGVPVPTRANFNSHATNYTLLAQMDARVLWVVNGASVAIK